jgi:hypothetical protein
VTGRRLLVVVALLAAIGIPAAVLQAACVGKSCDPGSAASARVPFCPLPATLKTLIVNGYREGRSPDVLAVAGGTPIFTQPAGTSLREPWPSVDAVDTRVPIAFGGAGIIGGVPVADGTTLDAIAPTLAAALRFERPFPNVRSGSALAGVTGGETPTLVVMVVWKGVGTADLEAHRGDWPYLASLLHDGVGTIDGSTGSLPLDPAATITTIGTGGLPSDHGITGSFIRGDDGQVVRAFGDHAPVPVVTTLADDLDAPATTELPSPFGQRPNVSLVATARQDLGLVGGDWYPNHDRDAFTVAHGEHAVLAARSFVDADLVDDAPDVLGVVLDGSAASMDERTRQISRAAMEATGGSSLVVVAGSGTTAPSGAVSDQAAVRAVEDAVPGTDNAIGATVPGGFFLDQDVLTAAKITGQVAVDAAADVTTPDGRTMMADAFQGFAVSFARYC